MRGIVQIAGIRNIDEARMLFDAGVDWIGFPFHLPVHSEDLSAAEAAAIVQQSDASRCVLITYMKDAQKLLPFIRFLGIHKVQLHGPIETGQLRTLRDADPKLFLIKSLVVREQNFEELTVLVERFSSAVDAFITDTFDPVSGASGATGKTHDWNVSRKIVALTDKPVILAGGLTAENIEDAIRLVRPAGVDAHTGVEDAQGAKDPEKVRAFVAAARRGFDK